MDEGKINILNKDTPHIHSQVFEIYQYIKVRRLD